MFGGAPLMTQLGDDARGLVPSRSRLSNTRQQHILSLQISVGDAPRMAEVHCQHDLLEQ